MAIASGGGNPPSTVSAAARGVEDQADIAGARPAVAASPLTPPHAVTAPPPTQRRPSRRTALAVAGAAVLSVALLTAALDEGSGEATGERRAAQPVTEYPPAERGAPVSLDGRDLDGGGVNTGAMRGELLVLNVWGSWCAPCRTEAPVLRSVSAEYASRGVQFLGINVKDNPAAAAAFERRFDITYSSLDDRSGQATLALSDYLPASVVPATLVLDRQGRVAARVLGAVEDSTLRSLLDTVSTEP